MASIYTSTVLVMKTILTDFTGISHSLLLDDLEYDPKV